MITSVWARTSAILLAALLTGAVAQAQNAVTDWNTIASTTIVAKGGKGPHRRLFGWPTAASPFMMR